MPQDHSVKTCPVCHAKTDTVFVCRECWFKLPAKDRQQLSSMHRKGQDVNSKYASCLKFLKLARG